MGRTLLIKVKDKGEAGENPYRNEVNLMDPNLIALVLKDLEVLFNAPIQKACSIVLKKEKTFPLT